MSGVSCKCEVLDKAQMHRLVNGKNPRGKVSDKRVNEYARRMRARLWKWMNGDTIVISKKGLLLDGFHRLTAALLADIEPECLVVRGADDGDGLTKDQGWGRKFAQILHGDGVENSSTVAAAIRLITVYHSGDRNQNAMVATRNRDNSEWITEKSKLSARRLSAAATASLKSPAPKGTACAVFYLVLETDHPKAEEFIARFCDGVGLAADSPILAARRFFTNSTEGRFLGSSGRAIAFALMVKAWCAFRDGESVQVLKIGKVEDIMEV